MSETLSQDPDGLGVAYTTLATPSSTVQDVPPGANLPPFSTFSSEIDSGGTFSSVSDRIFSDTRLLDISNWDYYTETRLVERGENGLSIISSQPQYRPWESKPVDSTSGYSGTTQVFTDSFSPQNGASKLPSFQSQFQAFSESGTTSEPTLTTLTNLTPVSPNSASSPQSQTLTSLNSSFHTLSAVNPRSYPLVPAPIQAREIPSIQQQFLDERHIQLYSHPTANLTLNNTIHSASIFPAQNGAIIQNSQIISSPTVVTVLKSDPDLKLGGNLTALHQADHLKLQNVALHPTQFQNPMALHNSENSLYNGLEKKLNGSSGMMTSPTRNDFRKKERRKIRANSLESSAESDGASSNMDLGSESSGQVAAVSSTDGFKNQAGLAVGMEHDINGGGMDKQVKKKRKRCGECIGCQRKDNCGDCAPCRNDKSHQICKQRRCEKLTEKKNLYGEPYMRGESRRGRGKGRGASSYRGRKPNGPITPMGTGGLSSDSNGGPVAPPQQPPSRPSPQPVPQPVPVQQQPMAPMPFYADPNRFPTPVWQADPSQVSGWQGQFIQQIPSAGQPIDTYQQYPNGIYQATYQQPAFETNTFYTGAVQVLTPTNARPPSVPNQSSQIVPPRPNSNYSHTPSPSPANQGQQQPQQSNTNQQQPTNSNRQQFQEYNQFNANNSSNNEGSQSRPSSVNSGINQNPPTPNQNYQQNNQQTQQQTQQSQTQQQTVYANVSTANFSPGSNHQQSQFVNANSGNGQPGYPQVNASSPQVVSHSSSGYPGNEQYSGQQNHQWTEHKQDDQIIWDQQQQHQVHDNNEEQHQHYQQHYLIGQHSGEQSQSNSPTKMSNGSPQKVFSQPDRGNLNTRLKTMILNKQQNEVKDQEVKNVEQNPPTGHFLWYSHHHHLDPSSVDGGSLKAQTACYNSNNTQKFAQSVIIGPTHKINTTSIDQSNQDSNNFPAQSILKHPSQQTSRTSQSYSPREEIGNNAISSNLQFSAESRSQSPMYPTSTITSLEPRYNIQFNKAYDHQYAKQTPTLLYRQEGRTTPQYFAGYPYLDPRDSNNQFARQPQREQTNDITESQTPKSSRKFHCQSPMYTSSSAPQLPQAVYRPTYQQSWEGTTINQQQRQSPVFTSPESTKMWFNDRKKVEQRRQVDSPHCNAGQKPKLSQKPKKVSPKVVGEEIPQCNCFPLDQSPPEPGAYYTHLGCANSLKTLRHNLECQTGFNGPAIRIEKVRYTGKEGKTAQGCPIVKWVHRRVTLEEKFLVIVKHRTGHSCQSAFIVVGLVLWEGIPVHKADDLYYTLTDKITKFGLPTKRRCATNERRTCACQGIKEDTCGASFTFGCSWSMYYNGCKFTRSKDVRKFRLSVQEEETVIEEKLQDLADQISPIYKAVAPQSFRNQTMYEHIASDCRLGRNPGRPFSGVTACMDFCAHSHKDIHNMVNGCTVVVTLTKHRGLDKVKDEQLHVLPMYVPDDSDEFGSRENQLSKVGKGEIEVLTKFECEVRTFSEPAEKCKIRKNKKEGNQPKRTKSSTTPQLISPFNNAEIQNGHVSSTVSPHASPGYRYDDFTSTSKSHSVVQSNSSYPPQFSVLSNEGFGQATSLKAYPGSLLHSSPNFGLSSYGVSNPFDDWYKPVFSSIDAKPEGPKQKTVDSQYTDNAECFSDSEIGGVAIALTHGSVLFECAKHELHATTALKNPNRADPTRISLVFYQHRNLNKLQHGLDEYTKQKLKDEEVGDSIDVESSSLLSSLKQHSHEVILKATTPPTFSYTTIFPMYPCTVTGAYQEPYDGTKMIPK